ncbi:MAG TPA: hypothetical protein PK675_02370 [Clostridia bacterium]|nr:hypothetical protein [Clostridia bacterium]
MKILLGILGLLLSAVLGSKLSEKYKRKERFYFDILSFCTSFRANLGFKRSTVSEVLAESGYDTDFRSYAENALLSRNIDNTQLQKTVEKPQKNNEKQNKNRMFSDQETVYIEKFFDTLGAGDADSQDREMAYYEKYFERKLGEAQETAKLRAPMTMKISILCGFLFCVLLI